MTIAITRLYCGTSGKKGFYNMQELGIAKAFINLGYKVYIILLSSTIKIIEEEKDISGVVILNVPCKSINNHGFFDCSVLLKYNIDIVHLQSDNQLYAPYVMDFCRKNNIKYYNYIGTLFSDCNNQLKRNIINLLTKRNLRYFGKSINFVKTPSVQKQLERLGIKSTVAPVGLDIDNIPIIYKSRRELREELKLPIDKKILIFVGRLETYKNPLVALDIIKELDDNFYLIIIGNGSLKDNLISTIKENNLNNKVLYIEIISNKDIHKYYKLSDFYLNFNTNEIFGMSLLEAMYQECIPIAFNAPGPSFIIEDGKSGYLVSNKNNMVQIIKKTNNIIINPKERITNNFLWNNTANIFDNYIRKVGD